jgi:predicted kinase
MRLPFEPTKKLPKREFLEMRNSLGSAIKNLKSGNNTILDAVYCSIQEKRFDVENVLFYNMTFG